MDEAKLITVRISPTQWEKIPEKIRRAYNAWRIEMSGIRKDEHVFTMPVKVRLDLLLEEEKNGRE